MTWKMNSLWATAIKLIASDVLRKFTRRMPYLDYTSRLERLTIERLELRQKPRVTFDTDALPRAANKMHAVTPRTTSDNYFRFAAATVENVGEGPD